MAGVSLLIVGLVRRRAWRAWQAEHRVMLRPGFGRSPRATWMAGVELRFGRGRGALSAASDQLGVGQAAHA